MSTPEREYPTPCGEADRLLGALLRAAPRDGFDGTPTEYRRLISEWSQTAWHPPAHGTELAVHTDGDRTVFVRPDPDGVAPSMSACSDWVRIVGVTEQ